MNIYLDFETFSSVPIAKAGAHKYISSSDFEILLCAFSLDDGPVKCLDLSMPEEKYFFEHELAKLLFQDGNIISAYNAAFEAACIAKHFQIPITQQYAARFRCTMLHGLYCGYPAGLEAVGKALGLPAEKQKLSIGKALIRYFCVPCSPTKINGGRTRNLPKHAPDKWELFKTYCEGDVTTETEIERRLSSFPIPDDIQKQWQTDLIINSRGVAVDMDMVQGALEIGASTRDRLIEEATALTGLTNPNSVQQLSGWLENQKGIPVDDLRKETVATMLENAGVDGDAAQMLRIRQELGKTSTKKYDAIEAAVGGDGRVRGLLQFYGANRSGRWAGRLVQVQNLPRSSLNEAQLLMLRSAVKNRQSDKIQLLYGSIPDILSQLIRTSFIASPGNILVDADFSAIEARVIAWLAGEQWRLEVFRTHGKIYEASASQMFGIPIERIKKGNPEYALRQKGKIAELALGYQGGAGALTAMGALKMGLSEEELPDIVSRWRGSNKRIVDLWYSVESAAVSVIQDGRSVGLHGLIFAREFDPINGLDFMTITLPSSRKLYYVNPRLTLNEWGKPSILYNGSNQTTKQWSELETYGGKLVENCLSGDALVVTDKGLVPLCKITTEHKLWDGRQWVKHDGLISTGCKGVIEVDGVKMTPEHKIYTADGWAYAGFCYRRPRAEVQLPYTGNIRGLQLGYEVRKCGESVEVYDIKNAGPNHCFTVLSDSGPMLVHNCVQAISRDCLATAIERLEAAGFPIVFHVHDEIIADCPKEKADLGEVVKLMTEPIPWAPDLPLNADGWTGDFFRKD